MITKTGGSVPIVEVDGVVDVTFVLEAVVEAVTVVLTPDEVIVAGLVVMTAAVVVLAGEVVTATPHTNEARQRSAYDFK